ncbi:MAG: hypothetical protein JXK94_09140 [Deltaproteobacteria bacterium]|nr:hypothetical protein [Deltaproteobacteria bacterium]
MSRKNTNFFCKDTEAHREHMCSLMELGKMREVAELSQNPAFVCRNCGVKADRAENLCYPKPLDKEES